MSLSPSHFRMDTLFLGGASPAWVSYLSPTSRIGGVLVVRIQEFTATGPLNSRNVVDLRRVSMLHHVGTRLLADC
jgi:hypothetical protein